MAQRTGQAQFRQIVSEDAVDQVQLRAGDRLLRLHHLHRIDHPGFHARARHLQGFLGNLHVAQETLDMTRARMEAGVINTVEVVQAQQTVASAQLDLIDSVFAHNLAKLSLARALGNAGDQIPSLLKPQTASRP